MRLEVVVPDAVYGQLQQEATKRKASISELVTLGIVKQLEEFEESTGKVRHFEPIQMGPALLPVSEWRDAANDRDL